jgi:hypothetical protein
MENVIGTSPTGIEMYYLPLLRKFMGLGYNFTVDAAGAVTDNHFGVLWTK